jgi:hypothetical protein
MHFSPKHLIQISGKWRRWSNPERTFHFALLKVDFDCMPDAYPGVLILTDPSYQNTTALEVKNPRQDLPRILSPLPDDTIAYWRIVKEDVERKKVLSGLTAYPIFDDTPA